LVAKGIRTRQDIIEKSLQLFCVKGYYNTSVSAILAVTGLTKGGFYGHFTSKEALWYAVYGEALRIWREVVFEGVTATTDPMERIQIFIENDIRNKLGNQVFEGGCFFHSMLVELSGQSAALSSHLMRGFDQLAGVLRAWLKQADQQGRLKENLDLSAIARHIVIALNGTAALHACNRDPAILDQALKELRFYIQQLQK
jgi:AcrR family transcriptional regulator